MRRGLICLVGACLVVILFVLSRGQEPLYAPGAAVLDLLAARIDELGSKPKDKPTGRYAMAAVDEGRRIAILDTKEGFLRFVWVPTGSAVSTTSTQEVTADMQNDLYNEFYDTWRNGELKHLHKSMRDTMMVIDVWAEKLARCQ